MKEARLIEGRIVFSSKGETVWSLPLCEVCMVGEYSTEVGPFGEDYFVSIVNRDGEWFDIGEDEGAIELLKDLSREMGASLSPGLLLETQFGSRILFPKSLEGFQLFDVSEPPRNPIRRLVDLFLNREHCLKLSCEAVEYIREINPRAKVNPTRQP